jgi:membrane associated rhomboid family serine protease
MTEDNESNITRFPDKKTRSAINRQRGQETPPSQPILNLPPMVKNLCIINLTVFIFLYLFGDKIPQEVFYNLAFVPMRYFSFDALNIFALTSIVTHMFVHAGWFHLLINLGMLMAFGSGVEKLFGGRKFLLFYIVTGIGGAFTHAVFYPQLDVPMIGASGAISGLFGAVLFLMQDAGLMGKGYKNLIPAIAVWIGVSIFFGIFGVPGVEGNIAWTTHIGGFVFGLGLYGRFKKL